MIDIAVDKAANAPLGVELEQAAERPSLVTFRSVAIDSILHSQIFPGDALVLLDGHPVRDATTVATSLRERSRLRITLIGRGHLRSNQHGGRLSTVLMLLLAGSVLLAGTVFAMWANSTNQDPQWLNLETRNCTLHSIASRAYLVSIVDTMQLDLLQHFLSHYRALGIRSEHMHLILLTKQIRQPASMRRGASLSRRARASTTTTRTSRQRGTCNSSTTVSHGCPSMPSSRRPMSTNFITCRVTRGVPPSGAAECRTDLRPTDAFTHYNRSRPSRSSFLCRAVCGRSSVKSQRQRSCSCPPSMRRRGRTDSLQHRTYSPGLRELSLPVARILCALHNDNAAAAGDGR